MLNYKHGTHTHTHLHTNTRADTHTGFKDCTREASDLSQGLCRCLEGREKHAGLDMAHWAGTKRAHQLAAISSIHSCITCLYNTLHSPEELRSMEIRDVQKA